MLRTVSQVTTDLAVAFPQNQLQTKPGSSFQYVPWDDAVRVLDRIFTPFGWSAKPISYSADAGHGVYLAAVELTVSARDEESGETVSVSRCGFGRSVASPTRDEAAKGITVAQNLQLHDTAASAAGSDALVKATKLLGDAFALYLYGENRKGKAQPRTDTATSRPQAAPAGDGFVKGRPSAKQLSTLLNAGYTKDEVDGMDFKTWKANLDYLFANNFQRPGAAPSAPQEESDDIPF